MKTCVQTSPAEGAAALQLKLVGLSRYQVFMCDHMMDLRGSDSPPVLD